MPLMPDVPADAFYGLGNLGQRIVAVATAALPPSSVRMEDRGRLPPGLNATDLKL